LKTIVLGLGNPIRTDDGVGNQVAQALERKIKDPQITVTETNAVGLGLLDLLTGFDRAIIIDAVQTEDGKAGDVAGDVYRLSLGDLKVSEHISSVHEIGLATALELGRKLGLKLPEEIIIFAIEVADVATFSEKLTPEVEKAVPRVCELVLDELKGT
jgi:hydrogenase maturation protease